MPTKASYDEASLVSGIFEIQLEIEAPHAPYYEPPVALVVSMLSARERKSTLRAARA